MSNDSDSVMLARLEERLRTLFENQEKDNRGKERMEQTLSGLQIAIQDMTARLKNVEDSLAKNEPTIEEFITIKHKVVGAGMFGKWVWFGLGAVITMIAAIRKEILAWFVG